MHACPRHTVDACVDGWTAEAMLFRHECGFPDLRTALPLKAAMPVWRWRPPLHLLSRVLPNRAAAARSGAGPRAALPPRAAGARRPVGPQARLAKLGPGALGHATLLGEPRPIAVARDSSATEKSWF